LDNIDCLTIFLVVGISSQTLRTGVPWEAAVKEDGKEFRDKEDEIFEKPEIPGS
jgi:hypothetical protein